MKIDGQAAKALLDVLIAGAGEHGEALDYGVSMQSGGGPGFFMIVMIGKPETTSFMGHATISLINKMLDESGLKQIEYPVPDNKKVTDEVLLRMLKDSLGGSTL